MLDRFIDEFIMLGFTDDEIIAILTSPIRDGFDEFVRVCAKHGIKVHTPLISDYRPELLSPFPSA